MSDTGTSEKALFADYWSEAEFANERNLSPRTLRSERARGEGAPYVVDGRRVYYPIEKARAWLLHKERTPVREPQAPSARRSVSELQRPVRKRASAAESATA